MREQFVMVPLNEPSCGLGRDMGREVAMFGYELAHGFRGPELFKRIEEARLEAEQEREAAKCTAAPVPKSQPNPPVERLNAPAAKQPEALPPPVAVKPKTPAPAKSAATFGEVSIAPLYYNPPQEKNTFFFKGS